MIQPKSGDGMEGIYESKWFTFHMLMFLKNDKKPLTTTEGVNELSISAHSL